VTDSRANDDGIRRRRQCIACGERFTTVETVQLSAVQLVKKDGRREDFNREKLLRGLRAACSKRNISVAQLEAIVADIEARIIADGRPEVPSQVVGELAMDALRRLDHIAWKRGECRRWKNGTSSSRCLMCRKNRAARGCSRTWRAATSRSR
jgi:transcriptional repressor NrdR